MFRCITDLKGLVIDLDSFHDVTIADWDELITHFQCVFLSSDQETISCVAKYYGPEFVYRIEPFRKFFAPNQITHANVLSILGLHSTEIAYVSQNTLFINNAMRFLGGTIWVTDTVTYETASSSADLVCRGFDAFKRLLMMGVSGYLGEVSIYPNDENRGTIIPLFFEADGENIPMYMLGRYFGYSHYMNQLHPYSTAIFMNKKKGKNYYRKFDNTFAKLYACAIQGIQKTIKIDGIVAVPCRPGEDDRFVTILDIVAQSCNIENFGRYFSCSRNYPTQKTLSSLERQENIVHSFQCHETLRGKNIVIIDDIITTGATMRECVRTLRQSGVAQIAIVVLGINQLQGNYWSSDVAQVRCPNCEDRMLLMVNGNTLAFFYSCYNCNTTLDFQKGRKLLIDKVNSELL